jgi:1,4-alpha-glucan branching enzyme
MSDYSKILYDVSTLTDHDIYLFKEGNHFRLYEKFGSHRMTVEGQKGVHFAVWAPNAAVVSVTGDFNEWNPASHPLKLRADDTGIWEGFIPGIGKDVLYKYHIVSRYKDYRADKGDPFAFLWQVAPKTASVVSDLDYEWQDADWMKTRRKNNSLSSPIAVYEMHPG